MKLKLDEWTKEFNRIKEAETAHLYFNAFLDKRESLDKQLSSLESEILSTKKSDTKQENLKNSLKTLKKERQLLDASLDEWDDLMELNPDALYAKLIDSIPLESLESRQLTDTWENYQLILSQINAQNRLLETCSQIGESLKKLVSTRESIRGKGIWRYVFGVSPNAVIERQMVFMVETCQIRLKAFEAESSTCKLTHRLSALLENLAFVCKKTWDFKLIDTRIKPILEELELLDNSLKEQQGVLREEAKFGKEKIRKMLREYADTI